MIGKGKGGKGVKEVKMEVVNIIKYRNIVGVMGFNEIIDEEKDVVQVLSGININKEDIDLSEIMKKNGIDTNDIDIVPKNVVKKIWDSTIGALIKKFIEMIKKIFKIS